MALNVGELQASMNLDISKFTRNMNSAKTQLKDVGVSVGDNVTDKFEDASDSTEEFAESLDKVSKKSKTMKTELKNSTAEVETHSKNVKDATKKNEEWKEGINGVKSAWGALKGALGAIGISASITALIGLMKDFIDKCNEAAVKYDTFQKNISTSLGNTEISTQVIGLAQTAAQNQAAGSQKFTYEQYAEAMTVLAQYRPELLQSDADMTKMADTYLRFAQIAGSDVKSAITEADKMMLKFNIDAADQIDILDTFYRLTQKTGVPLTEMITLLNDGDKAFQYMGYSAEEAAAYITSVWSKKKDLTDISTLIGNVNKLTTTQYTTFGTEEEMSAFIQRVMQETAGMTDETKVLTTIDSIFREMYPSLELDADTNAEINTNLAEIGKTMLGFAKLTDVTPNDVQSILTSLDSYQSLADIPATVEEQKEYIKSIDDTLKKNFSAAENNTEILAAMSNAKLASYNKNGNSLFIDEKTEAGLAYLATEAKLAYKTYEEYKQVRGGWGGELAMSEAAWNALKNGKLDVNDFASQAYAGYQSGKTNLNDINIEIKDSTSDGIEISFRDDFNAVKSVNNPA